MLRRILIATLMATSLSALCWEANVDYIYWKAAGSDLPWVQTSGPVSENFPHRFVGVLRPDYSSGLRVQIAANGCGYCSLEGRYLWVESTDHTRFDKPAGFNIEVIGQPQVTAASLTPAAVAVQSLPIHVAELIVACPLVTGCWGEFDLFAGVTYLYARRSFTARYVLPMVPITPTQARTRFSGAGPILGFRSNYHLFSFLDTDAELGLMTVIGEITNRSVVDPQTGGPLVFSQIKTNTSSSVGALLRLGCKAFYDCFGLRVSGALGWEHRLYLQVTSNGSRENETVSGSPLENLITDEASIRNLFVGGPYIGIGVSF